MLLAPHPDGVRRSAPGNVDAACQTQPYPVTRVAVAIEVLLVFSQRHAIDLGVRDLADSWARSTCAFWRLLSANGCAEGSFRQRRLAFLDFVLDPLVHLVPDRGLVGCLQVVGHAGVVFALDLQLHGLRQGALVLGHAAHEWLAGLRLLGLLRACFDFGSAELPQTVVVTPLPRRRLLALGFLDLLLDGLLLRG